MKAYLTGRPAARVTQRRLWQIALRANQQQRLASWKCTHLLTEAESSSAGLTTRLVEYARKRIGDNALAWRMRAAHWCC